MVYKGRSARQNEKTTMTTRRDLVLGLAIAPTIPLLARSAFAEEAESTPSDKLKTSQLVYITPIKSNGEESRCKAEIWFSHHDGDVFVVTPPESWRAKAVGKGLTKARLWVGDFGVWTQSEGGFRKAPEFMATASIETGPDVHTQVLSAMGEKYAESGWGRWGQRFKDGLVDGSRVMIRYALDA